MLTQPRAFLGSFYNALRDTLSSSYSFLRRRRRLRNVIGIGMFVGALLLLGLVLSQRHSVGAFTISSAAISDKGELKARFTCDGDGVSLPYILDNIPEGTASFALLMEEQTKDSPVHWHIWNIPPSFTTVQAGVRPPGTIARSAAGKHEYLPPCPPEGGDRKYRLRVYALSKELLPINARANKESFLEVVGPYVLDVADVVMRYGR
jgi:Raf kinase inhibitor-like YbhB/YbcL family protein